jgi:hypothetical protein
LIAAAAAVVLFWGCGHLVALRDDGTGATKRGDNPDDNSTTLPSRARERAETGSPRSAGGSSSGTSSKASGGNATATAGPRKAPPGTKGVGSLKPTEPPLVVVKDATTLEIEQLIDELMKEQP